MYYQFLRYLSQEIFSFQTFYYLEFGALNLTEQKHQRDFHDRRENSNRARVGARHAGASPGQWARLVRRRGRSDLYGAKPRPGAAVRPAEREELEW